MGEEIKIGNVRAENGGTVIQIDCDAGRLFVPTRAILKALNNYLQIAEENRLVAQGWEKIDPNAPPADLID